MSRFSRYLGIAALAGTLAAPLAVQAQRNTQNRWYNDHHDRDERRRELRRYYDDSRRQYREWNNAEERAYRNWLRERHERYRDFSQQRRNQQQAFWRWRFDHR